jgi:hypothetical protein
MFLVQSHEIVEEVVIASDRRERGNLDALR